MTQKEISEQIIRHVGGVDNIENMYHCMTRLRFKLKDPSKFQAEQLKQIPGVMNTVKAGEEYQLIIGAEVDKFYNDLLKQGAGGADAGAKASGKLRLKDLPKAFLNTIVGIMAPILPLIIAGGMVKVILSICVLCGMENTTQNYKILSFISDAPYYFLPFFIANSAAKKLGANQLMSMAIAGVLLHPNFTAMVNAGDPIHFLGLPVKAVSYGSSVVPIILTVWFMSWLEKIVEKIVPKMLKTMLRPMLLLVITAPVALIILGPLGSYLGSIIYFIINFLNQNIPWLVAAVMGTFSPLLVMVGMHLAITPFAVLSVAEFGYETLMGPGMLGSNVAQGGAALAIAFKERKDRREVPISAGITALSGITEPALYGVTLKYKNALPCVMISGGIAGLYAGLTGVVRYAVASAGFLSLPVFIGDNPKNIINAVITAVMALVLSFVSTYIFVKVDKTPDTPAQQPDAPAADQEETLKAVVSGQAIPLTEVKDEVFSSGVLGGGAAILPESGSICAPAAGTVTMVAETGHAVSIATPAGKEILIHVGIDTVQLKGQGFKVLVKTGDTVKAGTPLVDVDWALVRSKGYDTSVVVIATGTEPDQVELLTSGSITPDNDLMLVK